METYRQRQSVKVTTGTKENGSGSHFLGPWGGVKEWCAGHISDSTENNSAIQEALAHLLMHTDSLNHHNRGHGL